MIYLLDHADEKGLRPIDYGSPHWGARACALEVRCDESAHDLALFDLDLTTAAMTFLSDLLYGRVNPKDQRANFDVHPDPRHVASIIWSNIVDASDVFSAVQHLEPDAPGYLRAEAAASKYLRLRETPDIHVAANPDNLSSAMALEARLQQLGDLPLADQAADKRTDRVAVALRHFQNRHGLLESGSLDPATLKQLNVPIAHRIEQLNMTLERWRWVPRHFSEAPVVVNIPEYRVRAYDDAGHVTLSMPVIVGGAAHRRSPVMQASMTQVVFHPYWNVPRNIQQREILPHLLKSPSAFTAGGYEVVDRRGVAVGNPAGAIAGLNSGALRVRQVPGAHNALGAIKFVFPNAFDVYMHGTPQTGLFQRAQRDLSHGCIRVQDPVALAAWVLRKQQGWSRDRIEAELADPKTKTIPLDHPIPVLIVYGTGIAAEDGSIRFFDDVYGYDASLARALDALSGTRLRSSR